LPPALEQQPNTGLGGPTGEHTSSKSHASEIPLRLFREILFWPLALHTPISAEPKSSDETIEQVCEQIRAPWTEIKDPRYHLAPKDGLNSDLNDDWRSDAYAESHYFHDFVSDFLFQSNVRYAAARPFRLFRRTDIAGLSVAWWDAITESTITRQLAIERLNLYIFRTGTALLVLELRATSAVGTGKADVPPDWSLADAQGFHDMFRRTYIPYSLRINGTRLPGGVVSEVAWMGSDGVEQGCWKIDAARHDEDVRCYLSQTIDELPQAAASSAAPSRRAPILPHWRHLLGGALALEEGSEAAGPTWRQTADERLPTMAYVSVTAPPPLSPNHYYDALRRSDIVRLTFADGPSAGDEPYHESLLADFEAHHAFDWFRHWGTRHLLSGYAFVSIGAGKEDFDSFVATHFRRHYFQMGLLLHFTNVSLLAFSRAISVAAWEYQKAQHGKEATALTAFADRIRQIDRDFLQFTHRFHFTGVSNQSQAMALFKMWKKLLGLPELHADLVEELRAAREYLHNEWQRSEALQAEAQAKAAILQARAANRLASLAGIGVAVGMPASFLGMNVVANDTAILLKPWNFLLELFGHKTISADGDYSHAVSALGVFGASMLLMRLAIAILLPAREVDRPRDDPTHRLSWMLGICGGVLLAIAFFLAFRR
jgi:hypothetical protein